MVKTKKESVKGRERIGTIQMVVGLVLLVGVVISFFVSLNYFEKRMELDYFEKTEVNPFGVSFLDMNYFNDSSDDVFMIGATGVANAYYNYFYSVEQKRTIVYCTELVLLVLSIMLLLNGLANGEDKK